MLPGMDEHGAPGAGPMWAAGSPAAPIPAMLRKAMPSVDEAMKCLGSTGLGGLGSQFSATPARFIFRPRTGRLNWRLLHSLDLDRVVHEGDVDTVQGYMDNIMFARFSREDMDNTTDESIVKVVQLSQLCMEFLYSMCTASQQLLQSLIEKVKVQSAQLKAAESRSHQRNGDRRTRRRSLSRENELQKPRPLAGVVPRKCPYCGKRFQTEQYLHDHIMRRHPTEMFAGVPVEPRPQYPITPQHPEHTAVVHQPEPSPAASLQPPPEPAARADSAGAEKVAEALRSATAGLQEQIQVVQRDFSDALRAMRHDVNRVADNVNHVADDVGKLQQTPAPTPAAARADGTPAAPATPAAPGAPAIDITDIEKRHSDLERKVTSLLESNQRMLLNKIEAVAATAPTPAATSQGQGMSIEAQLEEFRRMQQDVQQQFADQVQKMAADAAADAAAKAAAAAAAAVAEAAPPPSLAAPIASTAMSGAWGVQSAPTPAVSSRPSVVVQEENAASVSALAKVAGVATVVNKAKPKAKMAEAHAPQESAVTAIEPMVDAGDSSKETASLRPGLAPPASTQPLAGAGVGGMDAEDLNELKRPGGSPTFETAWETMGEMLEQNDQLNEQLLLTIAMTQERTRPAGRGRGAANRGKLKESWDQVLSPDDSDIAVLQPEIHPDNPVTQEPEEAVAAAAGSKDSKKGSQKRASSGGFKGFFSLCRGKSPRKDAAAAASSSADAPVRKGSAADLGSSDGTLAIADQPPPMPAPAAPPDDLKQELEDDDEKDDSKKSDDKDDEFWKKIHDIYNALDRNGTGKVSHIALIKGLRDNAAIREFFGLPATIKQEDAETRRRFEDIFQSIDEDNDKNITLKEFEDWVKIRKADKSEPATAPAPKKAPKKKSTARRFICCGSKPKTLEDDEDKAQGDKEGKSSKSNELDDDDEDSEINPSEEEAKPEEQLKNPLLEGHDEIAAKFDKLRKYNEENKTMSVSSTLPPGGAYAGASVPPGGAYAGSQMAQPAPSAASQVPPGGAHSGAQMPLPTPSAASQEPPQHPVQEMSGADGRAAQAQGVVEQPGPSSQGAVGQQQMAQNAQLPSPSPQQSSPITPQQQPVLQRQATENFSSDRDSAGGAAGAPAGRPSVGSAAGDAANFWGNVMSEEVSQMSVIQDFSEQADTSISHQRSSGRANAVGEIGNGGADTSAVTGVEPIREMSFDSSPQDLVRPADKSSLSSVGQSEAAVGIGGWGAPAPGPGRLKQQPSAAEFGGGPHAEPAPSAAPVGIGGWGAPTNVQRPAQIGGSGARDEETPMKMEEADEVMGFSMGEESISSDDHRDATPLGMKGPRGGPPIGGAPIGMKGPPGPGPSFNDISMESM